VSASISPSSVFQTKGTWVFQKLFDIKNGELHQNSLLLFFFVTPVNCTKEAMVSSLPIPPTPLPVEFCRAAAVSQYWQMLSVKVL
jgi:hypothetical protein